MTNRVDGVGVVAKGDAAKPFLGQISSIRRLAPGLFLALIIAVVARVINGLNGVVPEVVIALVLGATASNSLPLPASFLHGAHFAQRHLLRAAIVFLGGSLSLPAILQTGGQALFVILACVVISLVLCAIGARLAGLSRRIGTLLGAGTSICGATAIVTIGPLIGATGAEMIYAIVTIFAYNTLAITLYPVLGDVLRLGVLEFGMWAGTSINDTSAVIATGYNYGDAAGQAATVVKLTRTLLLAPLAVLAAFAYRSPRGRNEAGQFRVTKAVPWFVLGFLAMALLHTTGLLPSSGGEALAEVAKLLIVIVMAAVGLSTSLAQMRKMGFRPLLIGLSIGVVMSSISLMLIRVAASE